MKPKQDDPSPSPDNPPEKAPEHRQDFPGRVNEGVPQQTAPGAPDGTGDRLEREPNQRPHDLDLHQCTHLNGRGIKGEKEEQQRREMTA